MVIRRLIIGCALLIFAAVGVLIVWFSPTDDSRRWLSILSARDVGRSVGINNIGGRIHRFDINVEEEYHSNGSLRTRAWILRVHDEASGTDQIYRRTLHYENGNAIKVVVETPWRKSTAQLASELASPGTEEVLSDITPLLARPAIRVAAYGATAALALGGVVLLVFSFRRRGAPPNRPSNPPRTATPEYHMGSAARRAHQFWINQLDIIQEKGILADEEKVVAMVGMFKRSQLVFLTCILARFLQKQYLLVVTEHRILLVHIPAFMIHGSDYHQYAEVPRPCRLQLPDEPHGEYFLGAKVDLPDAFASLVGRPYAYVVFGLIAQEAFNRAGQNRRRNPTRSQEAVERRAAAATETLAKDQSTSDGFIRFLCPECGKALKAQRAFAGRRVKCSGRRCGQTVLVPSIKRRDSP